MYYGGYNPNGYNPQNPYDRLQQMQMGQTAMQRTELTRVTGMDGAKAYQMPPNSTVALFDGTQDVFYVKSTDGAGFPTIRAFAFTPHDETPTNTKGEYVTRAEFDELKGWIVNAKQPVSGKQPDSAASGGE